ncbi:hypothetical protein [Azospirillum brasilense]|uniref:hypothetical protein n=1 Tax=Azospirillum brasilense TaxID=192 RepID=UPI000E6A82AA|nr:hypothetical protein [Azospirillum brasilense]NUB25733.1 hypothetical protein [Azospirillum brasilense]NUB33871.1 hypothetical protein [Azospirillum brasilense]RIW07755.1 hypothetical protein D2T81_02640 [Azospirillum brasilense]
MDRIEALTLLAAPLLRQRRPVRLSRINAGLVAAGHAETTVEELAALARPVLVAGCTEEDETEALA